MKKKTILLLFLVSTFSLNTEIIDSVIFGDEVISIKFQNEKILRCKRNFNNENYEYIKFKGEVIFLEPDEYPKFNLNLDSIINDKINWPERNPAYVPTIKLIFFIDKKGKVISHGFKTKSLDQYFNLETLRIVNSTTLNAIPAKIKKRNVASIIVEQIDFY